MFQNSPAAFHAFGGGRQERTRHDGVRLLAAVVLVLFALQLFFPFLATTLSFREGLPIGLRIRLSTWLQSLPIACKDQPQVTMQDWVKNGCNVAGSCAFCAYATGQATSPVGDPCDCSASCLAPTKHDRGIVCFSNPHDVNDHLCIFADYATGRNNLAFMDKQTVQANLQNMFAQAQDLTAANDVDKVCFHRPGEVSVAWTHGHFFNSKIDPHPDWVTDENSFCAMNPFTQSTIAAQILAAMLPH